MLSVGDVVASCTQSNIKSLKLEVNACLIFLSGFFPCPSVRLYVMTFEQQDF